MFEIAGKDAIHLGLGEPDFQPPEHIVEGLVEAVKNGYNKYASTFGILPLREAIAEDYHRYRKDITFENVMVTASATEALTVSLNTMLNEGDEVLTPNPGFVLYNSQIKLAGGHPVYYTLTDANNFLPDVEELERLITPRTKAIILNSPSNPTGSVIDHELWLKISRLCQDYDITIISDEVYDKIIYGKEHRCALEYTDNCVVINSFSKTLAMTGWRLGYMVCPSSEIIKNLSVVHYYTIACPPTPTQYAALQGYIMRDETERFLKNMVSTFRKRRDKIVSYLYEIEVFHVRKPDGAFYVYPLYDKSRLKLKSKDLAMKIAENGVICSPGTAFGTAGEWHLRFSFAASDRDIEVGIGKVSKLINTLI